MGYKEIIKNKEILFSSIRNLFDKHPIIKFILIMVLIIIYFLFVSKSHGLKNGFLISIISWSFFVLCTPLADAGILIDFPMRLISGIRMIYSEIIVWIIAISINLMAFFNNSKIYDKTIFLSLFKHIIDTPFPYWSIIILSGIGTFLSIYIADNLVDSKKLKEMHPNLLIKHKLIIFTFLILLILILYDFLLNKLGVQIPLI